MIDEHEVYVKRETAELLKKAGYNWATPQGYLSSSGLLTSGHFSNNSDYGVSAPTLEVAQRWLRNNGFEIVVLADCDSIGVFYKVYVLHHYDSDWSQKYLKDEFGYGNKIFSNFEEAQENGIINALNNLLNGQDS